VCLRRSSALLMLTTPLRLYAACGNGYIRNAEKAGRVGEGRARTGGGAGERMVDLQTVGVEDVLNRGS
jgi:hypothetical protein